MEFVEPRFIRLMWVTVILPVTMPHFYTFQSYFYSLLELLERDEIIASLRQLLGLSTRIYRSAPIAFTTMFTEEDGDRESHC